MSERSAPSLILEKLREVVGSSHVLAQPEDMTPYTTDWRGRFSGRAAAVVRPASSQEVSRILELANSERIAIVPQGGNTGLVGGATPDDSGLQVILSLARMNRVRTVDTTNDTIIVEAGCVLATVQQAASDADRLFPISLGAEGSCQIGGNISTNAGGLEVVRYGPMRDQVLGLEVVLPDGRIMSSLTQLRKNNTGYDLKQLFIGSEGTLGIVTAAALKLHPRPKATGTAFCGLATPGDALDTLVRLKERSGSRLSTFEIISRSQMDLVIRHGLAAMPLDKTHPWYLLVELTDSHSGASPSELLLDILSTCMESGLVSDAILAQSDTQRLAFWKIRHSVSESNLKTGMVLSHDTSVPVSLSAEFIRRSEQAIRGEPDVTLTFVGHMGDGNVHANAVFDRSRVTRQQFDARAPAISERVYEIAASLGGSISAEHGIGVSLRDKLPAYKDPVELQLMRELKRLLDPHNVLNPSKLLNFEE